MSVIHILVGTRLPLGTLFVNCLGSFLVGFVMSILLERVNLGEAYWRFLLIAGFLSAFTTFSSFAWETWVLYNDGY